MPRTPLSEFAFAKIYSLYLQKAERKNRQRHEVNEIICWLTGYDEKGLQEQIESNKTLATFFEEAPYLHPNHTLITGVVCGVRVETITDPLLKKIRLLDKLMDELAQGRSLTRILHEEN